MVYSKIKLLIEILELGPEETGIVRFTKFGPPQVGYDGPSPPTQLNVEERLHDVLTREHIIPVSGEYWDTVHQFLTEGASYRGEFDRETIERLGICDHSRKIVKIYSDGIFFPTNTE